MDQVYVSNLFPNPDLRPIFNLREEKNGFQILTLHGTCRLGGLSQAEQRELEQRMQKRQVKEFVGVRTILSPPLPSFTKYPFS